MDDQLRKRKNTNLSCGAVVIMTFIFLWTLFGQKETEQPDTDYTSAKSFERNTNDKVGYGY